MWGRCRVSRVVDATCPMRATTASFGASPAGTGRTKRVPASTTDECLAYEKTRSPGFTAVTFVPTATTVPTLPYPGM